MYDVSIIIPCFNKVEFTLRCLQSLAEHTPADRYQVVLVDNASTDATPDLCAQLDGDVIVIRNETNLGFARACNQGACAATGRHLLFLNNDTEAHSGWLEPLLAILDTQPDVSAVGSKLLFPNGTLQHAGVTVSEIQDGVALLATHDFYQLSADLPLANERRELDVVTAACVAIRRKAFDTAGGFDEGYWNGYEDVDLCLTMRELGWKIVYEPASVLTHHESVSGPERFRATDVNIERLQQRWAGRYHPAVLVTRDIVTRPHPTSCRVHILVAGPGSSQDRERTERHAWRMLHGEDTIEVAPDLDPVDVVPSNYDADWVLVLRSGVVPHPQLLDRLLLAPLVNADAAGPALDRPGPQNHANFASTDRTGISGRAAALAELTNQCGWATDLDPVCRLLSTTSQDGTMIIVPSAYAETAAVTVAGRVPGARKQARSAARA